MRKRDRTHTNLAMQKVVECFRPLDHRQGLGDLGNFRLIILFPILQSFPLLLKVLDHRVPPHVACSKITADGRTEANQITGRKQTLLRLGTEGAGRARNRRTGVSVGIRIWSAIPWLLEVAGNLAEGVLVEVGEVSNRIDPLVSQLQPGVVRQSHLICILEESRRLIRGEHHGTWCCRPLV